MIIHLLLVKSQAQGAGENSAAAGAGETVPFRVMMRRGGHDDRSRTLQVSQPHPLMCIMAVLIYPVSWT